MRSHEYRISSREWRMLLLPPASVLALALFLVFLANRFQLLPSPAKGWDAEFVVIEHQTQAARVGPPTDILLLGDSTCLAGVDAPLLSRNLPGSLSVRNLGLFIWLGFQSYSEVMRDYMLRQEPRQTRTVLLLVSPRKLSEPCTEPESERSWQNYRATGAWADPDGSSSDPIGVKAFRRSVLSHLLAKPLKGPAAVEFGFASGIHKHMSETGGSLPMFSSVNRAVQRNVATNDYHITPEAIEASVRFRKELPDGARLVIGLTPRMKSLCPPNEAMRREELVRQWTNLMQPDCVLTNLPPFLPDVMFAEGTHLNRNGQQVFTRLLARELEKCPP